MYKSVQVKVFETKQYVYKLNLKQIWITLKTIRRY